MTRAVDRDRRRGPANLWFGLAGKTMIARAPASMIVCASISARVCDMPAAGHSQTNVSGPGEGNGHTQKP
jgi:hypothetical protein